MDANVEYKLVNSHWTFTIKVGPVTAQGDKYPGTKRGQKEMKRDAANILRDLRKKHHIIVKR